MKHRATLLLAAITIALASEGQAQDNWEGWYAGLSLNGSDTNASISGSNTHKFDIRSESLGAFAGYNINRGNGFVWGPELSLNAFKTGKSAVDAALGTSNFSGGLMLTPKVRAGFATDRFYFYGSLGLGITDAAIRPSGSAGKVITISPAYGLGVEMAMENRWSARLDATFHGVPGEYSFGGATRNTDINFKTISLGLSRGF